MQGLPGGSGSRGMTHVAAPGRHGDDEAHQEENPPQHGSPPLDASAHFPEAPNPQKMQKTSVHCI